MKDELIRKIHRLIFDKRGVNVIISSVMLCSAVIAMGFVVFAYTQHQAVEANVRYADNTNENIATIQEKLAFEYIHNNSSSNELTVFLINCGKSDDVVLVRAYLSKGSWAQSFEDMELKFLNGTITQSLDVLEEGVFQFSIDLEEDASYSIRILTARGRNFVTTFVA
ncbi:MAG: hypothetical protein JSW14_06065 [Candidatus Bathyarchaeum sp.]|nr:MAG: hypothetical protein JSW14_06065 [Candidatus Bathyarchaeum sp.]